MQWEAEAGRAVAYSAGADEWTLEPSVAHPRAQQILVDDFFWNCADDNSPLGSDTGSDTLAFFREWRGEHPTGEIAEFVGRLLVSYGVAGTPADLTGTDEREFATGIARDGYQIVTYDDTLIGIAFAQGVLEGRIDRSIREEALLAVRREASDAMITYRGWVDPAERRDRLDRMRTALELF